MDILDYPGVSRPARGHPVLPGVSRLTLWASRLDRGHQVPPGGIKNCPGASRPSSLDFEQKCGHESEWFDSWFSFQVFRVHQPIVFTETKWRKRLQQHFENFDWIFLARIKCYYSKFLKIEVKAQKLLWTLTLKSNEVKFLCCDQMKKLRLSTKYLDNEIVTLINNLWGQI